ncbi:MAG: hypothetical protein IPM43_07510 [Actinomycetota bacterium]|nr:MAG: hypothetical protein IPM43_07510 [Actinomycetota bacterium]
MTDAPLPSAEQLVSRAVDSDLPTELAALVAADPGLTAEVAVLRALRRELAEVPAMQPAVAEQVVRAALDVFDAEVAAPQRLAPAPAEHHAPLIPLGALRWRRRLAWAGAIAAAGLLTVGVAGMLGQQSSDDSASKVAGNATTAATEDELATAEVFGTPSLASGDQAVGGADDTTAATADAASDSDRAADGADEDAPGDFDPSATAAPAATDGTFSEPFPMPPAGEPVQLADEIELAWFAAWAVPTEIDDTVAASVPCADAGPDELLAQAAEYAGIDVTILRDDVTGEVYAYAVEGCAVVASTAP